MTRPILLLALTILSACAAAPQHSSPLATTQPKMDSAAIPVEAIAIPKIDPVAMGAESHSDVQAKLDVITAPTPAADTAPAGRPAGSWADLARIIATAWAEPLQKTMVSSCPKEAMVKP